MSERKKIHPLYEIAFKYKKVRERRKSELTAEDRLFENQWFILRTDPPVIVEPLRWLGEPYKSDLIARIPDGKRLKFDKSYIVGILVKRFISENDRDLLAKYLIPKD